jgi:hypothetical protein
MHLVNWVIAKEKKFISQSSVCWKVQDGRAASGEGLFFFFFGYIT